MKEQGFVFWQGIIIAVAIWLIAMFASSFLWMPVHEWYEIRYSDNGSVMTEYHCSSPTWWDKITNSEEWQKWEEWERNNPLEPTISN